MTQYRQKKMFRCNQEALYEELGVNCREGSDPTSTDNARKVWSEIWDKRDHYKEDTEWLVKVKKELQVAKIQNNIEITGHKTPASHR